MFHKLLYLLVGAESSSEGLLAGAESLESSSVPIGAIIGVAVGVFLLLIAVCIKCFWRPVQPRKELQCKRCRI